MEQLQQVLCFSFFPFSVGRGIFEIGAAVLKRRLFISGLISLHYVLSYVGFNHCPSHTFSLHVALAFRMVGEVTPRLTPRAIVGAWKNYQV